MNKEELMKSIDEHFQEMDYMIAIGCNKTKLFKFVGKTPTYHEVLDLLTLAIYGLYKTMDTEGNNA